MSEEITLNARKRTEIGTNSISTKLRKSGSVPAIMYGHGIEPQTLWVESAAFGKAFEKCGENTILSLSIDGCGLENVLVHDVQYEPVEGSVRHIDFFRVRMDEEVETEVPLVFSGEPPAVKNLGGTLVHGVSEVRIRALPAKLPKEIIVSVDRLATFDDRITIGDLAIPDGVEVVDEIDTVVAMVAEPRTEEEEKAETVAASPEIGAAPAEEAAKEN